MIDIINGMAPARAEIIKYCSKRVDNNSLIWIKELLSEINRKCLACKDDNFVVNVWPLYKNFVRFFTEFCDDVTPGAILVLLYISSLELGVRSVGDKVENLNEFVDEVDMEDWHLMSVQVAKTYDFRTEALMVQKFVLGLEITEPIWSGGIRSLSCIDYIGGGTL